MKKTIFLLSVGLIVFAIACKKKSDGPNYPDIAGKTVRQILMMQDWKFSAWADSAENDTKWTDEMDPCMKDDVYSFFSNTKYLVKENGNKCYPTDYEVDYTMPSDNSTLVTFFDGNEWELVYKSNTQLIFWRIVNGTEQHFQKVILTRP
ncbi:MAG: hypothetical protein EBV15_02140 [Bacteroidetes bacterium]|jgi:hypothetical protein|nr:hypothetical protein [Bacteroidota bacterium]